MAHHNDGEAAKIFFNYHFLSEKSEKSTPEYEEERRVLYRFEA
jgi:hypothetical protein